MENNYPPPAPPWIHVSLLNTHFITNTVKTTCVLLVMWRGGMCVQGHVKAVLLIFQLTTADPEAPVHTDKVTVQLSAGKT